MADLVSIGFKADSSGIKQAGNELDKLSKKGATTDKSVNTLDTSFRQLKSTATSLGIAFAALGVSMGAREIVQYSDQWKNVNSQLRQVTSTEADLIKVRRELLDLSKDTRSELTNTVDLYAQLTRSTKDLGVSSGEVLSITKTLNNLFVAGGKPISEVSGAIRQLSQGFAAGALRGDEFNSVAEGAPKIMDALGKALKMTRGELREFAATGGITAEIMVKALSNYSDEAQKMADQTEKTFGQSMTNASTNTIAFVGSLESVNGIISTIGNNIETVTGDLENYSNNVEIWASQFVGISNDIDATLSSTSNTFSRQLMALGAITHHTLLLLGGAIMQFPENIRAMVKILTVELASAVDIAMAAGEAFASAIGVQLGLMVDIAKIRIETFGNVIGTELALLVEKAKLYGSQIADAMNPFDGDTFNLDSAIANAEQTAALMTNEYIASGEAMITSYKSAASSVTNSAFESATAQIEASRAARIAVIGDALAQRDETIASYDQILAKINEVQGVISGGASGGGSFTSSSTSTTTQSKNLDKLIKQVDNFGDSWSNTAGTIAQAMGDIVGGLDAYSSKMEKIADLERDLKEERKLSTATTEDKLRIDKSLADLEVKSTRAQLSGMAQISGAASSLFAEQSKEREALHKMEQVYTAIEIGLALQKAGANALTAITASFAAPFPVNFAAGAAMIGIMAGLGVFSGSGGGSAPTSAELQATQGTGTTLGDSEAKSESIINALEEYNDIGVDQLSELVAIRNAMSNLASGIENLAISLVTSSSFGGGDISGLGTTKAYTGNVVESIGGFGVRGTGIGDILVNAIGDPLGNVIDRFLGNFKKTTVKLLDTGIAFDAQTLGDMIATGAMDASYYNVIETTKRSFWGLIKKTGESTEFTAIETAISDEFVAIFGFLGDTVTGAIESLGVDAAASLEGFAINLPNISFKDMSGEEIQAELEAIFSQQGDLIAEYMLPQIKQFQDMGEGALETLARVAKEQAYFNDAIDTMGLSLGDLSNLMRIDVAQSVLDLMGGLEAFSEATNSYVENFFSDSEKMEMLGSSLSDVFDGLGLPMVDTTDGFRDLVASIDLTTLAGQEMFATLMSISPAMAEYIEMLDDQEEAIKELARDAYDDLVLSVEAEKDGWMDVLEGAQETYADEIDGITGAIDGLTETFDTLTSNLDDAKSAMTDSFDAQKRQIIDASALRVEAIQQEIDASTAYHNIELDFLSDRKSALNDMISGLSGASSNLRSVVDVDTNALSSDLANALSQAQRGNFNPAIALGDISSLMGDSSQFSSAAQMNVSRGVTGFAANELANLVDNQLSVEERTLALLEQQTINETARYDAEQAMLAERIEKENDYADAQTAALDEQLNNLLGINTGVLSVDASIIAFQKAQDELNSLDYERQLEMLAEQEEWAMEALDVAEQNSQDQIDKLDGILNNATNQINALYNINTSVLSVQEAIFQLQTTITNAEAAQATRDAQIAKQTRKTADGIQQINAVGVQTEAIA